MPRSTKETAEKKKSLNQTSTSKSKSTSKTVAKKSSSTKKSSTKVARELSSKDTTKKATSTKKVPSKTKTTKLKVTKKSTKPTVKKTALVTALEYYDLPYRYNQTVVKMLAQTPKRLFVYWDISDDDRNRYIKKYGEKFFENTKPVLIIHNKTMNYSFEIEINDFANSWYFDINDEKCEYSVELGRRKKEFNNSDLQIPNNYLYITSSNEIESPNGHILFEKTQNTVFFRNVKTGKEFSRNIASFEFMRYFGKIYNAHDVYKKMYSDEDLLDIDNPSSSFKIY